MGSYHEWDALCGKYESAQDDNTAAYLAISARLFTGGGDGKGPVPTAAEIARWDVARARLAAVDVRMRRFVAELRDRSSAPPESSPRRETKGNPELH